MFVVYFYEDKNVLLSQFRNEYPSVGEDVKIKGRKGKVISVNDLDERYIHVQVVLEKVKKAQFIEDPRKRKRK